jgi:hypothetical protein
MAKSHAGRNQLPSRRGHEVISFEHAGHHYVGGIGRFDKGQLAEVFLNSPKTGTGIETAARDAAVAASLLLQFGCPAETLRHALTHNADGSAAGPLGHLLDMLAADSSVAE